MDSRWEIELLLRVIELLLTRGPLTRSRRQARVGLPEICPRSLACELLGNIVRGACITATPAIMADANPLNLALASNGFDDHVTCVIAAQVTAFVLRGSRLENAHAPAGNESSDGNRA